MGDLCVVICLTIFGWVVIIRKTDRMRAQSLYSGNISYVQIYSGITHGRVLKICISSNIWREILMKQFCKKCR